MGQCSTLPADSRPTASTATSHGTCHTQQEGTFVQSVGVREDKKKKRLSDGGRKDSLDFNVIVSPETKGRDPLKKEIHQSSETRMTKNSENPGVQNENICRPQARSPVQDENEAEAMDIDAREQAPSTAIPPPPEGSVRTRCYKLNLNADYLGLSGSQRQQLCLGPYNEPPPFLTYSSSEDSCQEANPTKVAIRTAQIFRGITIGRDGTILSQNARATRSSRGSKTKRGEKSRQAAKIDKAKDLVEEAVASAKNSEEPSNMVSLVIVGEYDDMKQLVRDGSKKLREAEGLPDEALLSINRPRAGPSSSTKSRQKPPTATPSSRKRSSVSPNFVNSQRTAAMQAPEQVQAAVTAQTISPPKLKSHPRDTRPTRREDRASMRMRLESCSDFMDPRQPGASGGNGDWSHAWNIWNCVGSGAVSPLQPSSPDDAPQMVFEGRESANGVIREGGATGRAN